MRDSADTCPAAWRRYKAGSNLRVTRSPVPPKSNMSKVGSTATVKSLLGASRRIYGVEATPSSRFTRCGIIMSAESDKIHDREREAGRRFAPNLRGRSDPVQDRKS